MNGIIKKYLYNEVSLIISIAAIAIGITLFITQSDADMERDIAVMNYEISEMKENELPHIEKRLEQIEKDITQIKLDVREILTILNGRSY